MKRPDETRRRRECCNEKEVRREKPQNYAELEGRRREWEETLNTRKMKTVAAQQQKHSIRPAKMIKPHHPHLSARSHLHEEVRGHVFIPNHQHRRKLVETAGSEEVRWK